MTAKEMVTEFAIRRNWKPGTTPGTVRDPEYAPVVELLKALNVHLVMCGLAPEEYPFSSLEARYENPGVRVPETHRWLVAFAVEGGSEGYYVHVGAICQDQGGGPSRYVDLGFCKTWDCDQAYAIAKEAQRFLTAAEWN